MPTRRGRPAEAEWSGQGLRGRQHHDVIVLFYPGDIGQPPTIHAIPGRDGGDGIIDGPVGWQRCGQFREAPKSFGPR